MSLTALAAKLKALRLARGLSVQQVADALGTPLATVYYWEAGVKSKRPGPAYLARLFALYDPPPEVRDEINRLIALGEAGDASEVTSTDAA